MIPKLLYQNSLLTAIDIAKSIARDYRHGTYSGSHLMSALMHEDVELVADLEEWGIDVHYLKEWASYRIANYPKNTGASEDPEADAGVVKLMEMADVIRIKIGASTITPMAVFIALFRPGSVYTEDQVKSLPITESELLNFALQNVDNQTSGASGSSQVQSATKEANGLLSRKPNLKTLSKFCVDKTALARDGKLDPIVGRDGEIRQMVEVLSRRTKPNVLLVGEPGVGKTALVEGFALNIVNEEVTGSLKTATVIELDVGALIAGASYKGEFEDRLKKVIKEVKLIDKAILFIDEIHVLLDPKGAIGNGAVNLLKPELARGAITVIGATTNEEYRKFIEGDEAFNRRFEKLQIEEPKEETAVRMLKAILPKYEDHHTLKMSGEAIERCVSLAKIFLRERSLPDSAVDLMDRTMAAIRLLQDGSNEVIEFFEKELEELTQSEIATTPDPYLKELRWLEQQLNHRLSPILITGADELEGEEKVEIRTPEKLVTYLKNRLGLIKELAAQKIDTVDSMHITSIVSYKTGIPAGKIKSKEREKLLTVETSLGKRVIGQDHALSIVGDAIRTGRTGVNDPEKPVASFFFMGPTGTGKTELTKAIADFLFNDPKAILRFDMSEFKQEHATAALLGAEPGYIGYENGGPLINKIRQQPYAVVLFDEIEKANKEIFDVFLKICDEGKAKDKLDKEGDFSKSIIVFTSNIGYEYITNSFAEGKIPDREDLEKFMKAHFRPEFLGRIDGLIPFAPLTEDAMIKILAIHFKKLQNRMEDKGIGIELSEAAQRFIAKEGFSPEFGARPLIREIKIRLNQPLSKLIIQGEVNVGDTVLVDFDSSNKKLTWNISPKEE